MYLMALRCMRSSSVISLIKWGLHNYVQYVNCERTREMYSSFFVGVLLLLNVLRRSPRVLYALGVM